MDLGELDPSPRLPEVAGDPVLAAVVEAVVAETGTDPVGVRPAGRLEELGVDSLGVLAVVVAVEERLGVRLPDDEVAQARTVADLVGSAARQLVRGS